MIGRSEDRIHTIPELGMYRSWNWRVTIDLSDRVVAGLKRSIARTGTCKPRWPRSFSKHWCQPVNRTDFLQEMAGHGIRPDAFSAGRERDEAHCLAKTWRGAYEVFYFEPGHRIFLEKFGLESDALEALLRRILSDASTRIAGPDSV